MPIQCVPIRGAKGFVDKPHAKNSNPETAIPEQQSPSLNDWGQSKKTISTVQIKHFALEPKQIRFQSRKISRHFII
jgi:hypothetical protein